MNSVVCDKVTVYFLTRGLSNTVYLQKVNTGMDTISIDVINLLFQVIFFYSSVRLAIITDKTYKLKKNKEITGIELLHSSQQRVKF